MAGADLSLSVRETLERSNWKVAGAAVRGFGHETDGSECEDHFAVECSTGDFLVALVADGAGSAKFGGAGAALVAEKTTLYAVALLRRLGPRRAREFLRAPGRPEIERLVARVRADLAREAQRRSVELKDLHATLLACMAGNEGGFFFHIGDGAGLALSPSLEEFVISPPENGEYAETTYFVTADDWKEHLRITSFGSHLPTVCLMSDGVSGMAVAAGPTPFLPFLAPLDKFLSANDRPVSEAALAATLASDRIRAITQDDKTLLWASRTVPDA